MRTVETLTLSALMAIIVTLTTILAVIEFNPEMLRGTDGKVAIEKVELLQRTVDGLGRGLDTVKQDVAAVKTTADKAAKDVTDLDAKADRIALRIADLNRQLFDDRDGQIMNLWRSAWTKNRATAFGAKLEAARANKRVTRVEENVFYLAEDAADGDGISATTGQAIVEQGKPETVAKAEQEVANLAAR